jgi:hypothetical protein
MPFIRVVECACGEHFHREDYAGDRRNSDERLTAGQLDAHFGPSGWQVAESGEYAHKFLIPQKPDPVL